MTPTLAGCRADAVRFEQVGRAAIPALAPLYVQMAAAHGNPLSPEQAADKLARMLSVPCHLPVLFHEAEDVVGYAIWADMGDHAFVRNFLVVEGLRRRGLGAALFARFAAEVLPAGRQIRLDADAGAPRAFWEAQGFSAVRQAMRRDPAGCVP